ncbi:MAG TPA: winged helix-turn-helix domain-containing protein [Aliidongia sp.]|uniref:winged helix-turn-helix domain-containing protein n=1 Tax=Aliidongia sp. TaxID=1914230 RepID=UPI002DDD291F|nr:winged helix-turn-helix domain-containing protein [Aliidongia sp.]HEV2673133.1 winged helix-turn-helix domain-containing protein [Aliidongia sp.]
MNPRERFSAGEARRIALGAQGFGVARPETPEAGHFKKLTRRLGVVQIDSVNVLARAHYLPAFSRLGAYETDLLHQAAYAGRRRHLFEYWAHEASYVPVEYYPLLRWRMERAASGSDIYGALATIARDRPAYVEQIYEQVRQRGPIAAGDLEGEAEEPGPRPAAASGWWGWSDGKRAMEYLFWAGRITTASRRGFERLYDLTERVLPRAVLAAPVPDEADAQRELMAIASRALGIATEPDLRDYFRLKPEDSKARLAEMVEAGTVLPVAVKGWSQPAYLDPAARLPRRITARTLLSPFDPLVFERTRTERMWDFRYRIEIYVPEAKRVHGYYVLPFLLGEKLVARVDLKADRQNRVLLVPAAHVEGHADPVAIAPQLHEHLVELAGWLGLERIEIGARGDLAPALQRHARDGMRGGPISQTA